MMSTRLLETCRESKYIYVYIYIYKELCDKLVIYWKGDKLRFIGRGTNLVPSDHQSAMAYDSSQVVVRPEAEVI